MPLIRNLLFQPITLNTTGDHDAVHLGSRKVLSVPADQISPEIVLAAHRGFVKILPDLKERQTPSASQTGSGRTAPKPRRRTKRSSNR